MILQMRTGFYNFNICNISIEWTHLTLNINFKPIQKYCLI